MIDQDQHQAPDCEHSELAVGWALHALEPAEEILVAEHLPTCAECTRTVAETELVGATLGLSVSMETPSDALEQRVLAIAKTPQISRAPQPEPTQPAPAPTPTPPAPTPPAQRQASPPPWMMPPPPRQRPRRRREPLCIPETVKLLAVALLVFAMAVAMVFYVLP